MKLKSFRDEIDSIDNQLAALYAERMKVAKQIALAKKENSIPIENKSREKEIIDRVTSQMANEIKPYANEVFSTIFSTSKAYQLKIIESR